MIRLISGLASGLLFLLVGTFPSDNAFATDLEVRISGYAEYLHGTGLVVDGQLVTADQDTKFKPKEIIQLSQIPLGYEVTIEGRRLSSGRILAAKVEAKPNGSALYEPYVLAATNQMESAFLAAGKLVIGQGVTARIDTTGPECERSRAILSRLLPPYVDWSRVRVYVVDSADWNACAMANGAIWVYRGFLTDFDDDELAIVLGHELVHYTHEHTRREQKKGVWIRLAGLAAALGMEKIGPGRAANVLNQAAELSLSAWKNGYSRDLEDQADRVGLRYAYEAGFNASKAPRLWQRMLTRYGELDPITSFFHGDHSRASQRIQHLQEEIATNYATDTKVHAEGARVPESFPPTPRVGILQPSASNRPTVNASLSGDYPWWKSAFEAEDPDSQFETALIYVRTETVRDKWMAVSYFRKAADQGHVQAQIALAEIYLNGKLGVSKDPAEGLMWYIRAAEQGDPEVQAELGDIYYSGDVISVNYPEAARWFRKAAAAGLGRAQFNLGAMYINGQGVAQDVHEAARWMESARQSPETRERAEQVLMKLRDALSAKGSERTTSKTASHPK